MVLYVNKNIDQYKDDFFKGLTFRQTMISAGAVICGACMFLLLYMGVGLPQSVSLYLTLPVVFPIAAAGFLRIHGMSLIEYMRRRRKVRENPIYLYHPVMLQLAEEMEDDGYFTGTFQEGASPDGYLDHEDGKAQSGLTAPDAGGLS